MTAVAVEILEKLRTLSRSDRVRVMRALNALLNEMPAVPAFLRRKEDHEPREDTATGSDGGSPSLRERRRHARRAKDSRR